MQIFGTSAYFSLQPVNFVCLTPLFMCVFVSNDCNLCIWIFFFRAQAVKLDHVTAHSCNPVSGKALTLKGGRDQDRGKRRKGGESEATWASCDTQEVRGDLKVIVHPRMKIQSRFTLPYIVDNPYDFLFSTKHDVLDKDAQVTYS